METSQQTEYDSVFYNHKSEDKQHKIPTSVVHTTKMKIAAILNYTANINFLSERKLCLLLFTEQNQYNEATCTKKDLRITMISRSLKTSHASIYAHCCSELVSGNFYKYTTQQEP